ncbi:MAG: X-Pro dipeptidyl-peptidase, partial [Actinomycetota bacterium]|nr:X-Pro dipeptidyl-peptidase [Actinomycetota bacterium]
MAAAALLVPAASAAGASTASIPQATNGTSSGPTHGLHAQPGTASTKPLPDMDTLDGPRYSLKDAIVEHALVPSRNGIDSIWVDIIRPRTEPGVKVPTIMDASPYFNTLGRGWQGDCKTPHSV